MHQLDRRPGFSNSKPAACQNFLITFRVKISKPGREIKWPAVNGQLLESSLSLFTDIGREMAGAMYPAVPVSAKFFISAKVCFP
jgi:hypothetical protein